jgi:hypothetical protein
MIRPDSYELVLAGLAAEANHGDWLARTQMSSAPPALATERQPDPRSEFALHVHVPPSSLGRVGSARRRSQARPLRPQPDLAKPAPVLGRIQQEPAAEALKLKTPDSWVRVKLGLKGV